MSFSYEQHIIPQDFYRDSPDIVGPRILGNYLVRRWWDELLVGKIVEVEAYLWPSDPASHSFQGKNERNKSLWGEAGRAYIHRSRHHILMDVVTQDENTPTSFLIRALEPVEGLDIMKQHRQTDSVHMLTNGPGKLCQALAIDMSFDGMSLSFSDSLLFLSLAPEQPSPSSISYSPRIGISQAADLLLRYSLRDNPFVSR